MTEGEVELAPNVPSGKEDMLELSLHTMHSWGAPLTLTESKYRGYKRVKLHTFNVTWAGTSLFNVTEIVFARVEEAEEHAIRYAALTYRSTIVGLLALKYPVHPNVGMSLSFAPHTLTFTKIENTNGHA